MIKKIFIKFLVLVLFLSMIPEVSQNKVQAADYFQASLEGGVLQWDVYDGAIQYRIIILSKEREPVASFQKDAYYFEDTGHQFCRYDVMAKLQEMGESREGEYISYVQAIKKNGDSLAQSIEVTFSFIPHIHQWDGKYQYDKKVHWCNCKADHCYVTSTQQKKGYGTHSFTASVLKKATANQTGIRKWTCKVCGYSKTESIPKLTSQQQVIEKAPLFKSVQANLSGLKEKKELSGSSFVGLQAKTKKIGTNKVTLSWKKVPGALEYGVYGSECGKKLKKITLVKNKNAYEASGLKKGSWYKFVIVAIAKDQCGQEKAISISKSVHVITAGNLKYGNFSAVSLSKKKVTVKKKKSVLVKAKKKKAKKTKVKEHRKLSFESSDSTIATVNAKGKITGKKKGKCTIYVYAQNGVSTKVSVTVK